MNKLVTILSFSSRNNGNCANISDYLSKHCPQLSEQYTQIMDTICRSDLVYFIVPNYCGYPSSNYFAFNERSVGYFGMDRNKMERYMNVPKRFIIVSNTEGFEDAMRQQTADEPKILYLKSRKYGKHSISGDILESDAARADLDGFLKNDSMELFD